MASLRDVQRSFAAALRNPAVSAPVWPPANLSIYRNNASANFRGALAASFPVILRRVGDDYFDQLAHHYREQFPSRSGDLHFVGQDFAAFLAAYLRAGDYAWLADLALIEWSREEALVSPQAPAVGAEAFAQFLPEQLEQLVFSFQPSLRLHASAYPVFSVWHANQAENAPPVDQFRGPESGMIRVRADSLEIRVLEPQLFSYLYALAGGATLGGAMELADMDGDALARALGFLFTAELVTAVDLQDLSPR